MFDLRRCLLPAIDLYSLFTSVSDHCKNAKHKFTSSLGSSAKPCKLTNAEDVSPSPDAEATGVEMTFISATYTPADKHLKSTYETVE